MTTGLQCSNKLAEGLCCLQQGHRGDCKTWDQVQAEQGREQQAGTSIQKWADGAMFAAEPMPLEKDGRVRPRVYLVQATADPLGAVAAMCKMYKGEVVRDITQVTDEERKHYWEESHKTHLKAPWEAIDLHFMVEGVTRSFTHQMVRQRTAVYAQESMRFAVKEGFSRELPLPPSLMGKSPEDDEMLQRWNALMETIEREYEYFVNAGMPEEDARGCLPHQVTTRLNYKTNFRNLIEHVGNRLCTQAQFEWRLEIAELIQAIRDYVPINRYKEKWQFELIADSAAFRPVCYSIGKCPFTADFDRGCTIRPRVEEGKFDEIDPREWLMDPTAAFVRKD